MLKMGFPGQNVFLLGKNYSTNPKVISELSKFGCHASTINLDISPGTFQIENMIAINALWEDVKTYLKTSNISKIIILDDGGRCISSIPEEILRSYKVIAVEQTTKGIRNEKVQKSSIPVISVATSKLKRRLESKTIARSIFASLNRIEISSKKIGIIGLGNIGHALMEFCLHSGLEVYTFDKYLSGASNCESLEQLFKNSDLIFGCTGKSIQIPMGSLESKHTFLASCSSEDIEFSEILNKHIPIDSFKNQFTSSDLRYEFSNSQITLLQSGFPVNFRNDFEIEPFEDIQLTRTLLCAGIFLALRDLESNTLHIGLNELPETVENFILDQFLKLKVQIA